MYHLLSKQYPNYLVLSTLLVISLLFPTFVRAAGEFSTAFDSQYLIDLQGPTQVTHTITLTNNYAHIYPTEYSILLGSGQVSDVTAAQNGTPTPFSLDQTETSTTVTLTTLRPVIGQDQSTTLTLTYLSPDITDALGQTLAINIPRLAKGGEAESFSRTVLVPPSLGLPTAEYPSAATVSTDEESGYTKLLYKGSPNHSLSILFGTSQTYHLHLSYQINNPTLSAADTEIALPPDTAYQKVTLESLDPTPLRIQLDQDGNWLAVYSLSSKQSLTVHAELYLEVFPLPINRVIPSVDLAGLTQAQDYWETTDPAIQSLAQKLSTVENIYQYLTGNLKYSYNDLERGERLGAVTALTQPDRAICTEFTDSFIALARASGTPARELNGFTFTTSSPLRPAGTGDTLHSWPDYYDDSSQTWIQIDPTWGQTTGGIDYFHKLDFSHLAFVIHGQESSYPIPAGAYKTDPQLSTIRVELAETTPSVSPQTERRDTDTGPILTNTGKTAVIDGQVGYLPPYGSAPLHSTPPLNSSLLPRLLPWGILLLVALTTFLLLHRRRKH